MPEALDLCVPLSDMRRLMALPGLPAFLRNSALPKSVDRESLHRELERELIGCGRFGKRTAYHDGI